MAGIVTIIEEARIKGTSIYWMSIILGVLLIAGNIESVQNLSLHLATTPVTTYYESSKSNQSYDISRPSDTVELPNYHGDCPIPITEAVTAVSVGSEGSYPTSTVMMIENLMNNSIWRIEANVRSCYKGKYNGQRPNWLYCDDMIVSRWETTNTGTIKYRWYTAVIAQWRPKEGDPLAWRYVFDSFSCENGKKVSVDKEKTAYYVHVSRDGTEIKIEY